jgi:hypothetical protein
LRALVNASCHLPARVKAERYAKIPTSHEAQPT